MRNPLTPSDCDLQDSKYMPMYVQQLLNSSFNAMLDDTAWRAGVTLWLKSWHQVPAASLPSDDEELCAIAGFGRDLKGWKKVRAKALRGWELCSDDRLYHPVLAEAALEAWIGALMSRISSGEGNAKRWGTDFDRRPIEAQLADSYELLKALNPRADAVQKIDRRNAKPRKQETQQHPAGMQAGVPVSAPVGSQPEPEPEVVIEDADDSAGAPDHFADEWPEPAETARRLAETTGIPSAQWQLLTTSELLAWRNNGFSYGLDVVPAVTEAFRRKRDGPPRSWAYFTPAIAQHHANRLKSIDIPEAQANERSYENPRQAGDQRDRGRSTDYLRIAIDRANERRATPTD